MQNLGRSVKSIRFFPWRSNAILRKCNVFGVTTIDFRNKANSSKMVDTQLGTMTFGAQTDEKESDQMVDLFLNKGFNWVDTAFMYTSGKSEMIVGNLPEETKSKAKSLFYKIGREESFVDFKKMLAGLYLKNSTTGEPAEESSEINEYLLGSLHVNKLEKFECVLMEEQTDGKGNLEMACKHVDFNPLGGEGLSFDGVVEQLQQSLTNLKADSVDLFYLHWPDYNHPIEETLKACDHLHKEGKFNELGVCNYAAWQLVEIYYICKENNWVVPTVYQGMYNPVTRMVEAELFPCIRRLGLRFYAYNLLAGGLLTGKHKLQDQPEKETKVGRFFGEAWWSSTYRKRFWHKEYFDGVTEIKNSLKACYGDGAMTLIEASNRWMYHHSMLSGEHQDGVILGASSFAQLKSNMEFIDKGPLDPDVVAAFDRSWERVKGVCPRYNR